jgi:S1-C subfamily serine protease
MSKISHNRYSVLSQLSLNEQRELCIKLCNFFNPLQNQSIRVAMKMEVQKNQLTPLSIIDFLMFHKSSGLDLWPKMMRIKELIRKLCQKGILSSYGGTDLNEHFFFTRELSNLQRLGTLWLGEVLGSQYIGTEIEKDIAYITGTTSKGDISVGTGILISPNAVLTCAHVLSDMTLDNVITVSGQDIEVKDIKFHDVVDVGIIFLKNDITRKLNDLAFRDAALLEEVVIAGYPTIPRSLKPVFTLQRGEISGFMTETMDKYPLDLFSAIARPGNSGGPVVGLDGCIVGIVTRSLEREKEEADSMSPLPFFASVPASVIKKSVLELTDNLVSIPWEDYS